MSFDDPAGASAYATAFPLVDITVVPDNSYAASTYRDAGAGF